MTSSRALALASLLPAALVAQAPEVPLGQALRAAIPEVQQLLKEYKSREALARVEGILPATVPAWADRTKPQEAYQSYMAYREYVQAFSLAAEAASFSGHWEKAMEYFTKARDLSKLNSEAVNEAFPPVVAYYKDMAARSKQTLEDNADFIKSLRSKANPDPGEKQQLDLIKGEEEAIQKNLKSADLFAGFLDTAKKEAAYYGSLYEQMAKQVESEKENLATYKFKDDKVKYVDGIMSAKGFIEKAAPEKTDRVRYLYRLNVLDPKNQKVLRMLETETGLKLGAAPEPKGKKG